ncbi:MAG: Uvr helicase/DDEDDh 3'-5' exonuclease [Sylvanvirus sp.]|uniref:DNA 3'-5' helicase n=1 Tax=Sylvanvirus sp. TaxID=2487774 RepID=A0A3G5AIT8_9VIRU|nr:MAG: Uvr helicase/DDEDDh 3'-5' exonuclease [Sylvanvirus sp.]
MSDLCLKRSRLELENGLDTLEKKVKSDIIETVYQENEEQEQQEEELKEGPLVKRIRSDESFESLKRSRPLDEAVDKEKEETPSFVDIVDHTHINKRLKVESANIESISKIPSSYKPIDHLEGVPVHSYRLPTHLVFTDEQLAVLKDVPCQGEDRVYLATAGAGKTMLVIEALVKILLPPYSACPDSMLVMAFNVEAALEIKQRLERRLIEEGFSEDARTRILQCPTIGVTIHSFARWAVTRYAIVERDVLHQYAVDEFLVVLRDFMRACIMNGLSQSSPRCPLIDHMKWIFVDEFQDVNVVQHDIVQMLRVASSMVTVIGDPNQNLYSWRGTQPHFLCEFSRSTPIPGRVTKTFVIRTNQRSIDSIVELSENIIGHNYEREEHRPHFKGYQSLPTYTGIRDLRKPKLFIHDNSFKGTAAAVYEIIHSIRNVSMLPHTIAILSRNNNLLNFAESLLRKAGIGTYFPRSEEDGSGGGICRGSGEGSIRHGRVYVGTVHQSKGREWNKVVIIGYHNEYFPDRREKELRNERNLNFVACSRAKFELSLYMCTEAPSLLIVEIPPTLFENVGTAWPTEWVTDARTCLLERSVVRASPPLDTMPHSWHTGVTNLLRNLCGETYYAIKQNQLIPTNIWNALESVSPEHDYLTNKPWQGTVDPKVIQSANQCEEMTYRPWIRQEMLEAEFGQFIDCLARRMIFEYNQRRFTGHSSSQSGQSSPSSQSSQPSQLNQSSDSSQSTQSGLSSQSSQSTPCITTSSLWRDKHAEECLFGSKQRNIPDGFRTSIQMAYELSQRKDVTWRSVLIALWRVSWCASFVNGRCAVAYIKVTHEQLHEYMPLFEKMAINLAHFVSKQSLPCQVAQTTRWRMAEPDAKALIHPLLLHRWPAYPSSKLASPNLVGEIDLMGDDCLIDFKNFSVGVDYIPVQYLMQLLLYAHMWQQSMQRPLKYIGIYNILADRWYHVSMQEWTKEISTPFVHFIVEQYYQNWVRYN